jgi:hypothetical protein
VSTRYRAVHANVHGIDSATLKAAERADVLHLNESRPVADTLRKMAPAWAHRHAASNAIAWRRNRFAALGTWRREVLAAKPGPFGWQSSVALAVLLVDRHTGQLVIHAVTHWPSKAWTVWPWRRKAWRRARRNTRLFVDSIRAEKGLAHVPVLLSLDGNSGSDWTMHSLRMVASPRTHGLGRYDRWLAGGPVSVSDVVAFRTGSDHKAVAVNVTAA